MLGGRNKGGKGEMGAASEPGMSGNGSGPVEPNTHDQGHDFDFTRFGLETAMTGPVWPIGEQIRAIPPLE